MAPISVDTDRSAGRDSPPRNYTLGLPDECLAYIFHSLPFDDRNRCSLVSRRWLKIEGQSRHRLSLNAQSDLLTVIPSIFSRFDSVTKLTLKCDENSVGIGDEALISISLKCKNLTDLTLYRCREITSDGVEALSKNCTLLKKISLRHCTLSARAINSVIGNCACLEELYLMRLTGITEPICPIAACSSLKVISLVGIGQCQCFIPLISASKSLTTLKLFNCLGPLDSFLQSVADSTNEVMREVHLEYLNISNVGLIAFASCCPNLEFLRLVKPRKCTEAGFVMAVNWWRSLKKLHIGAPENFTWLFGRKGLRAVANNCPTLEDFRLTGADAWLSRSSLKALASKCVKLERLGYGDNKKVEKVEVLCIAAANFKALKKLWFRNCPVSDHDIQVVAENCPNLKELELHAVNLTQLSLETLGAKCVNLERLVLYHSEIVGDAELFCIASNCNALKKLRIVNCPVSDLGIQALASGCPSLVDVRFRNCKGLTLEGANCLRARRPSLVVDFRVSLMLV